MIVSQMEDNSTMLTPELPEDWREGIDDMEWDVSDIMFLLKMQDIDVFDNEFAFCGETYTVDSYEAYTLSAGKSVFIYPNE